MLAPGSGGALLVAYALDRLGEPPARWHPVVWYGRLIAWLERAAPAGRVPQLLYGAAMLVLAAPVALLPSLLVQRIAGRVRVVAARCGYTLAGDLLYVLIEGSALKPFFALHMLVDAGRVVRAALEQDDLPTARQALQSLVSRDRSQLPAELVAAAAIESLAENLSDSIVAPLFYYTLAGLPGAALYRLCNTFDSMLGYRGRYEYLGKAAARLDDALNLLPARLTALLIIAGAPLFGGDRRHAWRIWRRDARKTASPNAGQPMSAAAGALSVQLEKVDHYVLGDNERAATASDIRRAERMVQRIGSLVILLAALVGMGLAPIRLPTRLLGRMGASPIGANVSIDELVKDVVGTGSQGDRQGRPYKDTHGVQPPRLLVRATLAVALQAAPSPYVPPMGASPIPTEEGKL